MPDISVSAIRKLDIDDLIIMRYILRGKSLTEISKLLLLTPPAISHRFRKYQEELGNFFEEKKLNSRGLSTCGPKTLTPRGQEICAVADKVLSLLLEMNEVVGGNQGLALE